MIAARRPELFVADLDGTLLDPQARLSAFAREALGRVLEAGALFTVASARSAQSMRPILGDLPLRLPVVTLNGAILTDLLTGKHARVVAIAPGALRAVMDAAGGLGLRPFVTSFDGARDNLYIPAPVNDGAAWYLADRREARDPRLREGYEPGAWLSEQIVSLTFIESRARLAPLADAVAGLGPALASAFTPHIYTAGWHWLTVHGGDASKDAAVRDLKRRHGLQGCRVVAFGDQANDVPLLRAADHGVAVANADAEAKEAAREIIGPNSEDSVPRYILRRLGLA